MFIWQENNLCHSFTASKIQSYNDVYDRVCTTAPNGAVILSSHGENDAEKAGRRWGTCENITNREDWGLRKVWLTSAAEESELEK